MRCTARGTVCRCRDSNHLQYYACHIPATVYVCCNRSAAVQGMFLRATPAETQRQVFFILTIMTHLIIKLLLIYIL